MDLLQPKDFTIEDANGVTKTYILSKFPAVQGREIIAKYPTSALPKIGDYAVSEETMLKLMNFVGVRTGEVITRLSNMSLVNNHVADWETLARIEMAMMEYNCSFFSKGTALSFFKESVEKILERISGILTASSAQSSPQEKQPFTSSEPSTL